MAIRYGWGSFPHANVGSWEDPLPAFRTDPWPLPKGQDLTPEDKGKARTEFYDALHKGFAQILDRKIRQGRMDAAISEMQLNAGRAGQLAQHAGLPGIHVRPHVANGRQGILDGPRLGRRRCQPYYCQNTRGKNHHTLHVAVPLLNDKTGQLV